MPYPLEHIPISSILAGIGLALAVNIIFYALFAPRGSEPEVRDALNKALRERDEARAEVVRLRSALDQDKTASREP